uniref:Uncharacterized protein n=1 Tax=Megaselia scalaris TaxID=36166 RepID=T1GL84_MEGSC
MDTSKCITKSLELTLFSCSAPEFYKLNLSQKFFVICVWIYGNVIFNSFNAKLYSFLTTLSYEPKIQTVQDIIDQSLKIWLPIILVKIQDIFLSRSENVKENAFNVAEGYNPEDPS